MIDNFLQNGMILTTKKPALIQRKLNFNFLWVLVQIRRKRGNCGCLTGTLNF